MKNRTGAPVRFLYIPYTKRGTVTASLMLHSPFGRDLSPVYIYLALRVNRDI
ncbi:hypothetical protein [Salinithrix halophila]|uniref:Uncharacterized protein n=1 Tax=Salinithrix halophila TaxID=1485204 RepID=A0ABV8JC39_9BACL